MMHKVTKERSSLDYSFGKDSDGGESDWKSYHYGGLDCMNWCSSKTVNHSIVPFMVAWLLWAFILAMFGVQWVMPKVTVLWLFFYIKVGWYLKLKRRCLVYFEEVVVWNNFKMFGCQAQMFHFKSLEQSLMQKMLNGGTVSKLSFLGLHLSGSSTG